MIRRYGAGRGLSSFISSRSVHLDEANAMAVIKGWLGHCMFLSRFALSEKDRAREGLGRMASLSGMPVQLETELLFDACKLANQFSLWDMLTTPLERLERLSEQTGYSLGMAQAGYFRAALHINDGKYGQAIERYLKTLPPARQAGDSDFEAEVLNDVGFCYRRLGDNERGEDYYRQSLKIREGIGNLMGVAESLSNLGLLYVQTGRKAEAERYLYRALEIEMRIGDKIGAGYTLVNLGFLMNDRKAKDEAERLFRLALGIRSEIGDMLGLGYCYLQLANVTDDAGRAEELAEKSHICFSDAGDIDGQLQAKLSRAEILLKAGKPMQASKIVQGMAESVAACPDGPLRRRFDNIAQKCRATEPSS